MPSAAASKPALTQCRIPFRTTLKPPARPLFALTVAVTPSPRSEWSAFPSLASAFSALNAPASSTLAHSPLRSVRPHHTVEKHLRSGLPPVPADRRGNLG